MSLTSEARNARSAGLGRERGEAGPSPCVELKTCVPRSSGEQLGKAVARLPKGNRVRGSSSLMRDCDSPVMMGIDMVDVGTSTLQSSQVLGQEVTWLCPGHPQCRDVS